MNRIEHLTLWARDQIRRHTPIHARVIYVSPDNGTELIQVTGPMPHKLQFGGVGDGYCYEHQSFDCLDRLTPKEWDAIKHAEEPQQ